MPIIIIQFRLWFNWWKIEWRSHLVDYVAISMIHAILNNLFGWQSLAWLSSKPSVRVLSRPTGFMTVVSRTECLQNWWLIPHSTSRVYFTDRWLQGPLERGHESWYVCRPVSTLYWLLSFSEWIIHTLIFEINIFSHCWMFVRMYWFHWLMTQKLEICKVRQLCDFHLLKLKRILNTQASVVKLSSWVLVITEKQVIQKKWTQQ